MSYRPRDEVERQPDTRGAGWLRDEAGRAYRDEKGTRVYQRIEERDDALDESYRLGGMFRAALSLPPSGPVRNVGSLVMIHAAELAELFWREAPMLTKGMGTGSMVDEWSTKHLGRRIEPAARGALMAEIRARSEGAGNVRTLALYDSYAEQRRYESAAAALPEYRPGRSDDELAASAEARCAAVVFKATGQRVTMRDFRMPHAPGKLETERRQNEQKAALAPLVQQEQADYEATEDDLAWMGPR